mmetsp:Transcript_5156/g.10112  ORF Transcript_5156/g.10112 Transcript_5156/m.10112 type:complete len:236 (+) Transcript_5156:25-732(+)
MMPLASTSLLASAIIATAHPVARLLRAKGPARPHPGCLLSSAAEGWGRIEGVETTARAFMDVSIGGVPAGRLEFDLFGGVAPRTVENFRCLCTGERGIGEQGKPLHYEGCAFHRIVASCFCQAGDIIDGTGTGGESIYGLTMEDEAFELGHTMPGLLSMAHAGRPNTSNSQFSIITFPQPQLDGKHVVFGQLVKGFATLTMMEAAHDSSSGVMGTPMQEVVITACGELPLEDVAV